MEKYMKKLVVFYSRTGTTKKVAQRLSLEIGAECEEINDRKKRAGLFGFFSAGFDAIRRKKTVIDPAEKAPDDYDLVLVGTPIWAGAMTPAVRTYLADNRGKIKKIVFFATGGEIPKDQVWADMETVVGQAPLAAWAAVAKTVQSGEYVVRLKDFAAKLHE